MMRIGWIILVGSLLAVPVTAQTQPVRLDTADLETIDHWRETGAFERAMTALAAMQVQDLTDAERAEVLWRIAWTKVDIGELTDDEARQEALYREADTVARAAIEADRTNAAAHLALAIASGRTALLAGRREKVERSREVKEQVDLAIRLDSTNDGAYHVRARWHYEVAGLGFLTRAVVKVVYGGLPEASYEQAVRDYKRAIALHDRIVHRLELGRTYLALGQHEAARTQLERALAMPPTDPDDPAYQHDAQRLLERL